MQELVLDELGSGALEDLVNHGPCEEQRRRIGGGEKEHIDGDHLAQPLDDFEPERVGVEPVCWLLRLSVLKLAYELSLRELAVGNEKVDQHW